jgi:hypothetical protein
MDVARAIKLSILISGPNDYSKWNFVLTSKYTTIKPGQNRITAKYECINNPALSSFSSVNVTEIPAAAVKQQQPANKTEDSSNSTANPLANIPLIEKLFGDK